MADPIKNYIRRSRPELASYRSRKSFWEKLADGNEDGAVKKKSVIVPSFGEIRKKFSETIQQKNRPSSIKQEEDNSDSVQRRTLKAKEKVSTAQIQKDVSATKDNASRKSPRRRSMEQAKATFLHMTDVMEGYIPSDTDSAAANTDEKFVQIGEKLSRTASAKPAEKVGINAPESDKSMKTDQSSAGSFRKRNRVRRRGSGKEARFDAVKKEDIESARLNPVETSGASSNTSSSIPYNHSTNDAQCLSGSEKSKQAGTQPKFQRQDSADNPLKRKRDKKLSKQKLTASSDKDTNGSSDSHKSSSYESKSVLSGIILSSPKSIINRDHTNQTQIVSDDPKTTSKSKDNITTIPSVKAPEPPKKRYESIFGDKKRGLLHSVDKTGFQESDKIPRDDHMLKEVNAVTESKTIATKAEQILPSNVECLYAAERCKDGIDSSSDTARSMDPIDINCSEHRWSTIDSGISVACALQQNADDNKIKQGTASSATYSSGIKPVRQRRYRHSTSSSGSDDDSGISWDELRDFRDVPVVVIDKVPDPLVQGHLLTYPVHSSDVKIELDTSIDKETEMITDSIHQRNSKPASLVGNHINRRFRYRHDEQLDDESESDQPLRTSTPTMVSVVLEPDQVPTKPWNNTIKEIIKQTITTESDTTLPESKDSPPKPFETSSSKVLEKFDVQTRPSRFNHFMTSRSQDFSSQEKSESVNRNVKPSNTLESSLNKETVKSTKNFSQISNESEELHKSPITARTNILPKRKSPIDLTEQDQGSPASQKSKSLGTRSRSKSETSEPSFFQARYHSLTRQLSPLDPMEDVLTKRSPFRMPSSLSKQTDSSKLSAKRHIPSVSQFHKTHTHSHTSYNMQPASLFRAKSNPILYEPAAKPIQGDDDKIHKSIKPVIRRRESSLPRNKTKSPPEFTPTPPQPTSLASRLLPQRRRSVHASSDFENDSSWYTPYTTDDDEGHLDSSNNNKDLSCESYVSKDVTQNTCQSNQLSLGVIPAKGVLSESDNDEQTPRQSIAPSLRLRQKVRSRNSSVSSRPMDLSFSDSECVDGTVIVRKRRRSRSRSHAGEEMIKSDTDSSRNNINVQRSSTKAGDRKIDTLDSHHQSQARRQISLSKNHKTSSRYVDRESDIGSSINDEQLGGSHRELKHIKDPNNNMICKQSRSLLSLEQVAEDEVIASASKLQIDLYKHKKHFEKDLSKKLESAMEESDNLVGAIRKSMNEPRPKDKVKQALKNVNEVIKFDIIRDYRAKLQWYKVEIHLGSYTQNVDARKTSNNRVTVSCEMPDGPKFSKDIHLDFPESVDLSRLEILQVGDDLELRAPFTVWNPPATMEDVMEADGTNPKDTFSRIGFLERAYHSLGLPWPPEGATAHYEYFSSKKNNDDKGNNEKLSKLTRRPPEYQLLVDSGQLKTGAV